MRLADFIRSHKATIVREWEAFARSLSPASGMTALQLKDHIEQILTFIARDIEAAQTAEEQIAKSKGDQDSRADRDTAAEIHGALRHSDGYDIIEMVAEYRALRASIIKLWTRSNNVLSDEDVLDLTRFNESIDQALAESVVKFTQEVDQAKDLLLGVLGHDIRNPLATIQMSAQLLPLVGPLNERQTTLATQVEASTARVRTIVTDLLDLAKARLGSGIPLVRREVVLSDICHQIASEMQVQHPDRPVRLAVGHDISGNWDGIRLGQVLSNLIGNAMQYGTPKSTVTVSLMEQGNGVTLHVHNVGKSIPRTHLGSIFQSFTRAPGAANPGPESGETTNLGLGLFISREIVTAHGGTITVTSNDSDGTTFSVSLPR